MTDPPGTYSVVFVCSGNICRSPVAEKIFRARLAEEGLDDRVRVASAGIGPWHVGEPMDRRAAQTLEARGYDTTHRARQMDDELRAADLLVAVTDSHADDLRAAGAGPDQVVTLRSFDPQAPAGAGVPDPYYGGSGAFDQVIDMTEASMAGLIDRVRKHT